MSYFPIARANKWRYTPAGTSGCEWEKIFDNSAFGYWLLAFGQKSNSMRGEGRCFHFATLCLLGIGFGIGFG